MLPFVPARRRYAIRDATNLRWQPGSVILTSVYDQITADIIEKARETVKGVSDRQYKLYEASFGTLLLQVTGVRDRAKLSIDTTLLDKPTTLDGTQVNHTPKASGTQDGYNTSGEEALECHTASGEEVSESDNNKPSRPQTLAATQAGTAHALVAAI